MPELAKTVYGMGRRLVRQRVAGEFEPIEEEALRRSCAVSWICVR